MEKEGTFQNYMFYEQESAKKARFQEEIHDGNKR
jgi:hypothetical protein